MTIELSPEQVRIAAILALPEAKGREASAKILALSTDTPVEDAAKLLVAFQPEPMQAQRAVTQGGFSSLSLADHDSNVQADHGWGEVIAKFNIGARPQASNDSRRQDGERRR